MIFVNAVFAFAQEYRAEKAVEALRRMLPVRARALRDGVPEDVATEEVVPGDVLLLAPGDRVAADADSGELYVQATTMMMAGIVMAQVGAGLAWRTNRRSIVSVGLFTNRLLLVGIAVEVAMIAVLSYTPRLADAFHLAPLTPWLWLSLLAWPPLVLGAEEVRKALLRRRG